MFPALVSTVNTFSSLSRQLASMKTINKMPKNLFIFPFYTVKKNGFIPLFEVILNRFMQN